MGGGHECSEYTVHINICSTPVSSQSIEYHIYISLTPNKFPPNGVSFASTYGAFTTKSTCDFNSHELFYNPVQVKDNSLSPCALFTLHCNVLLLIQCIRDVGLVILVCEDGDVEVRYISNSVFTFNPVVLVKVYGYIILCLPSLLYNVTLVLYVYRWIFHSMFLVKLFVCWTI